MRISIAGYLGVLSLAALVGCGGEYAGEPSSGGGSAGGDGDSGQQADGDFADDREFFAARVRPNLDTCRGCHVPGGVAGDTKFLLSDDPAEDYTSVKTAWKALGGTDITPTAHPILTYNAGQEDHSGGANWPTDSQAYAAAETLLTCWATDKCDFGAAGGPGDDEKPPLLGSAHAEHVWDRYCEGKPDEAQLPTDPRTMVRPGTNEGKAVYFNAYYQNCHVASPESEKQPETCGEYRTRRQRGLDFLINELPVSAMSAEEFNSTWEKWGLEERPENFEQMYTLRYGLNNAPFDNPYPLPGEDPNQTDGGSGQLPLGLRQLKDEDGNWTGQIGTAACFQCHGGQMGDRFAGETDHVGLKSMGLGNNNYDPIMAARDNSAFAGTPFSPLADALPPMDANTLFNVGIKQRGQNNAVGAFEFLNTLLDLDSLGFNPNPAKTVVTNGIQGVEDVSHPLAHAQDTPPWWNIAMRPRKFFDAGVSIDSTRIIMAAGPGEFQELASTTGEHYRDRIEEYDQDLAAYFMSLESPEYPREIDEELAKQGAILFHNKDLWAEEANADRPEPLGGNGSCAGCHGAYSPRYVNDPEFLEDPSLEGVAAHISPLEVIGTDPARSDMLTPTLRKGWDTTYWAYPESAPDYVAPENKDPATEAADDMMPIEQRPQGVCGWQKDVIGYQAPPLYGVWATAPYFHNGSVPTVEAVLDPSQRHPIWRRKLQQIGPVKGFDQRLDEAYDFDALGWKHDALTCAEMPGSDALNCNPVQDEGPSLTQMTENFLRGTVSWAGLVTINDPTPGGIEKRLVYDTRILGNDDGGHEFTDVLTEAEREAIIEYLKTL